MPGSCGSAEGEEGGAGSDDDSGMMRDKGSVSDPRWSRVTGGTKGWRLRGVEWRVKLGILPSGNAGVEAMRRATANGRRKYAELRRRLLVDPHTMDDDQTPQLMMDNPLSLDPGSVWGRYFRNAELEKTIDKDLTRLYPEHGVFFQSAPCQAMMRRILLVWSLIHPQFSYRQGMHELLAPLLYVLHVDVVRLSQVKHRFEDLFDDRFDSLSLQEQHVRDKVESAKTFCGEMIVAGDSINFGGRGRATSDREVDPEEHRVDLSVIIQGSDMYGVEGELGALLSARFLEHDAYCMLDALLSGQDGVVAMADYFMSSCGGGKPPVIEASGALYRTLAAADISLYTHLVELGVEPQFFALRWLRLLFGREFVLDDLLRVWDAIFGEDNTPLYQHGVDSSEVKVSQRGALIFSFSVSMLLYVRPALLAAPDVTGCLQRLLNFPQVPDVRDLIDSARSLQILALAAVKCRGTPVPRNVRTSEIRGGAKHIRSGSISPPTPQRHVIRPQNQSTSSPTDVLRLSMSLPGSYWEEKWTHSVLQKKNPEELFSPRMSRTESVPRDFDYVDRDSSNNTGMLSRTSSEGQHHRLDQVGANLVVRIYDSSQESSDDDGQEMLRRGGEDSSQDNIPKCSNFDSAVCKSHSDRSPRVSDCSGQDFRLDPGEDESFTLGQTCLSDIEAPQDISIDLSEQHGLTSSDMVSAEAQDGVAGCMDVLDRDQISESTTSDHSGDRDSLLQDSCPVQDVLDTCQMSSETHLESSQGEAETLTGSLTDIQERCAAGTLAMEDRIECPLASVAPKDTTSRQNSLVVGQSNALQSESPTDLQPVPEVPTATTSNSCSNESLEVEVKPDNEAIKGNDILVCVTSSKGSGLESKVDQEVEESASENVETSLFASKSKPPLPPSRLGRFNWMWSLGRTSFGEKAIASKVSKEDPTSHEAVLNTTGSASETDVSSSTAANAAAQRRKKSWWRANNDVVPEDCVETSSMDSSNAVDVGGDALWPVDLVKSIIEPAAMASEMQLKENEVAEITVTSQDAATKIPVTSQDASKKPKDMTRSAALQALGQSVLEHVQVLESALAQKVSILGIDNMMWTPAVREKSEGSTNRAGLGSKGQGAALAAITELRKISQALQQM